MFNRRLLSNCISEYVEPALTILVKDEETGAVIPNARVDLLDSNYSAILDLGITDNSGSLLLLDLTLDPGQYYFRAAMSGYEAMLEPYPYTVVDSSPIVGTITLEITKGFVLPGT